MLSVTFVSDILFSGIFSIIACVDVTDAGIVCMLAVLRMPRGKSVF